MKPCIQNSKQTCMNCKHYEYCDKANRCDGRCYECDIIKCQNNPHYDKKYIYMVQLDWSTTDAEGLESDLFENYNDAYIRYKERIADELNPEKSWVGEDVFDEHGNVDNDYEFEETGNAEQQTDLSWHVVDKNNYYRHTFIDLIKKELY